MARRTSQQLNAALAASIRSQPVAAVQAAIDELHASGLDDDASELEAVLADREQQLAAARSAKEREEEAERQKATAAARATFDAKARDYVALRDEALDALALYVERAAPGMDAYRDMQAAAANLDRLTGGMVQRPATASDHFAKDDRFKLVRSAVFNSRPL